MNTLIDAPEILDPPDIEAEPSASEVRELPPFDDAAALAAEKLVTPSAVIEGLLRRGEKSVLGGASKAFKSWTALDIAVCISHDVLWLGRKVTPGRVLIINLELPRWCIRKRVLDVAAARGVRLQPDRLLIWNLRSEHVTTEELRFTIAQRKPADLALVLVDPAYKLLHGRDENSACDIANLLASFEGIVTDTGAHVLVPTHFAKGSAAHKESQDRISGSGVFARDPDSILTLTRHERENAFTLEATLRTFPPVAPCVVRWVHPIFTLDQTLDPARLKKARPGPPAKHSADKLLALLPTSGLSKPEWRKKADGKLGMGKSRFYELAEELEVAGRVECAADDRCRPVIIQPPKPYAD